MSDATNARPRGALYPGGDDEVPDGYIVIVGDPQTGETDCYGPYPDAVHAHVEADRRRRDLDGADLDDVLVLVAPCTRSAPGAR